MQSMEQQAQEDAAIAGQVRGGVVGQSARHLGHQSSKLQSVFLVMQSMAQQAQQDAAAASHGTATT